MQDSNVTYVSNSVLVDQQGNTLDQLDNNLVSDNSTEVGNTNNRSTPLWISLLVAIISAVIMAVIMAVLGALGFFRLVAERTSDGFRRFLYIDDIPRDFEYKYLELGVRISDDGFAWESIRKAEIVSLSKNLQDIEIGMTSEDVETTAEYRVEPEQFKIINPPPNSISLSSGVNKLVLHSNKVIPMYRTARFTFHHKFRKTRFKRFESLHWASSTRKVKKLTLRLIFVDDKPVKVFKRVTDNSRLRELSSSEMTSDNFTKEYYWTIVRPRKGSRVQFGLGKRIDYCKQIHVINISFVLKLIF